MMISSSSTVEKHSPHHTKVKGSIRATTADTGREKMAKKVLNFFAENQEF
jgi:hypothetical protein